MINTLKTLVVRIGANFKNNKLLWLADMLMVTLIYLVILAVAFPFTQFLETSKSVSSYLIETMVVYVFFLTVFGNYRTMWEHAAVRDYIRTGMACMVAGIISVGLAYAIQENLYYLKFSVVSMFFSAMVVIMSRIAIKYSFELYKRRQIRKKIKHQVNVLIVGAGSAAVAFLNDLVNSKHNYNVVGLIDDNEIKVDSYINGKKVLGTRNDIIKVCEEYEVEEIILAIPGAKPSQRKEIIDICTETNCKVKTMPSIDQIIDKNLSSQIRNVNIEDLLARDQIILDDNGIKDIIHGKTIMVTGGGGSIGSELCRQITKYKPELLVIVDIYENNAYDLQNELRYDFPNQKIEVLIASVRDIERMESIFDKYRPTVVFYAAAHKHVPLMEVSPGEAIKNNIYGTYNVTKCADKFGVEKFVMISTDKAVNPTNVMGATKRFCEFIVQSMQMVSKTQFVSVRFGNVLGSNGSVIPLFKRQIEKGGPVTITHKDITRFFMTIPEAAQLVIQASCFAKGGEIFVLDMGEPVKIYDLAKKLIKLSGYEPDRDIEIKVTGLRDGEKLYEELLMSEEGLTKTSHSKIFIGKQLDIDIAAVNEKLDLLSEALDSKDNEKIMVTLSKVVPTYKPDFK